MQIIERAVSQLKDFEGNARAHDEEQLAEIVDSIKAYGFNDPVEVGPDLVIISGHARVEAANKIAQNASWEKTKLRDELKELNEDGFDMKLTGFREDELQDILNPEEIQAGLVDEDSVPEAGPEPITRPGDLWLLGSHRLMCGDATDFNAVSKLMAEQKADLVFTDPPYNVDYEGYTKDKLKIQQFKELLADTFANYAVFTKDEASMYVCHGSVYQREFQDALEDCGFEVRCQIIWAKNTHAWGFGRYKFQHESIFYVHKLNQKDNWYGDKTQSTLWEVDKPAANKLHPTMKPIALIEIALENSSKPNNLILDLFGGSGSTLIAREKRGRKCATMELDPKYCDVIVKRWQDFSGQRAVLERTGEVFNGESES